MIIRPATLEDASFLLPLMEQLGYPLSLKALQGRIKKYSDHHSYHVLVAEKNHNLLGFIALAFHEFFVFEGKRCRIEGLIVDDKHRGHGVGRHLIQQAEILAKQEGCLLIELTSGLRRAKDGSHEFYRALGYENDDITGKLYLRKDL